MNSFEVEIERNSRTYKATAKVDGGMLTVSSLSLGSKHASVSSNNEALAKILLGELVSDQERKK